MRPVVEARQRSGQTEKVGNKVNILGVGVSITSLPQVLGTIASRCRQRTNNKPLFVVTVNAEFIMLAQRDEWFKHILNSADLTVPDGMGVVWASRGRLGQAVPGRVLVETLVRSQSKFKSKYKIFFLGGRNGVAREMAEKYGGESDLGHDDVTVTINDEPTNQRIINKINSYEPDILFVAYGAPWQEKWLWAMRSRLRVKVLIGVGGAFDYLADRTKPPPEWLARLGFEWLWRLVHQPWRWKRQVDLVRFAWRVWFGYN